MEDIKNLRVYYYGKIIPNTNERVTFHCECPFFFVIPCTMSFLELQTGLDMVNKDVNVNKLGDIDWEEDNNNNEEEFEANYEVDDKNNDGDNVAMQHPFGVPSFMQTLDLTAMYATKFSEYAYIDIIGIEFGSRESVISAIKSYTISREVDYTMYESEPQTFYAKCKEYGASFIRKKSCWQIRRYNSKYTYTMGTISQDHAKFDSCTIADAIRPLVETDPSIKVKSIIAKVQFRFNYTVSYRKIWLEKQKFVTRVFGD
ncbi:hypothetical protein Ahy_A04g020343 [Arachis hypogaea]|uniref:Transposase MuDR plant domain-containing protein n=1 Tax=Arachis hypogaea TaxID=3818 RepID=A0A445DHI8_ARAHY|nr:hypothetical protein Ahy_A04g020343 [Arachis hypogaea]